LRKSFVILILSLVVLSAFAISTSQARDSKMNSNEVSYVREPMNYKALYYMEKKMGFRDPNKNYNVIINGHGTGLAPPTVEEYAFLLNHAKFVKGVKNYHSKGSADLSSSPYFPPVGNQGSQGSCAAWATAYYDNTFYQAKVHGWNDVHEGNYRHLMSPAWTYNKVNGGEDGGSSFYANYMVMYTLGDASLETMPYNEADFTSWGSENAWRDAPIGRIPDIEVTDVKNIDVVKSWIDEGSLATFALNANAYESADGAFTDGNYIVSWEEYQEFFGQPNHAQTIVGYDDTISDDGDVGAFLVVNSWGANWGDHGFYWLTYNAFSNLFYNYTFRIVEGKANEVHLLGIWEFSNPGPRDAPINIGIGDPKNPAANRTLYLDGGSVENFPLFMAADLTEYMDLWKNGTEPFFLSIGNSSTGESSVVSGFWIEYYPDEYVLNEPYRISWPSPDAPITTPGVITNVLKLQNDLSDLQIQDISISPNPLLVESNATISVTIYNGGNNASKNVTVSIYKDRLHPYYLLGTLSAGDIPIQGSVTVSLEITTTKRFFGPHKIIVYVDPSRQISELNESNNIANTSFLGVKVPSAPRGFSAERGDGYVLLSWEPPSDNGGVAITTYNVYRNEEKIAEVNNETLYYNDTDVDMKNSYIYYVTASNLAGEGPKSYDIAISWDKPSSPTNITLMRGDGYVVLSWNAPQSNGGTKVTAYNIYRNGEMIASTDTLYYNDTDVDMKNSYTYYVTAINAVGEGNKSDEVNVSWNVPASPQNLELTRGDGYVVLSWNAPQSNGGTKVTAYNIYRDGSKIATVDASSLTYRDENVDMQTEHTYYVTALNAVGESNKSQEKSVSWSTPSSPQNVKAKSTSDGALLSWDAPLDNGGSAVRKYEIYLEENGEWKKLGEATSNEYKLELNPTLTGGTAKVKIVPVNGVGPGEAAILEVNVPMNMMLWGAIIAVIIILIVAIVVVVKRKK